jgi:sugar-specific transcriptional regulator TrmB
MDIQSVKNYLKVLNLSNQQIEIYLSLIKNKKETTASELATRMNLKVNGIYRSLSKLESLGLLRSFGKAPKNYLALNIDQGLPASYDIFLHDLKFKFSKVVKNSGDGNDWSIVVGREPLYELYSKLAKSAQKEVDIYSIGIAYSEDLEMAQKDLVGRGVRVRHVIQQKQVSNYYIIKKWIKIGIKLKYISSEKGIHFTIIDDVVLITFSDLSDTENRITIVTSNKSTLKLFKSMFEGLWLKAEDI